MNIYDYPDLAETLKQQKKIVFLCGAGFSMSLGRHGQNWQRWITGGRSFLNEPDQAELDVLLEGNGADDLILAAEHLLEGLGRSGRYHDFMTASIGSLAPEDPTLAQACRELNRAGDFFATTNYDLLLEKAAGLDTVTYNDPGDILHILDGSVLRRVIHLHGAYDPVHGLDDIVADSGQYERIVASQGAQFIQNLLGTYPIVVIGCGNTVSDPNLKGFFAFVEKHLHLSVPYYYLHRAGEALDGLPAGMIPVCYGAEHTDLAPFLSELASFRLRQRLSVQGLSILNPYRRERAVSTAYGRMHFYNQFNRFIGRETEKARLDRFRDQTDQTLWWIVTGESGIGKSRLLLDWLRNLPPSWIGFFADARSNDDGIAGFVPFTNTVVVLDYIVGRERTCSQIMEGLASVFSTTGYQLRIVLLERHYDPGKYDWMDVMQKHMDAAQRLAMQRTAYLEDDVSHDFFPLHLEELCAEEEIQYIQSYLHIYLPIFGPDVTLDADDAARDIQHQFRENLDPECYRPLFLSIYIEVWLHNGGSVPGKSACQLLEAYLLKEEDRWRLCLNGDDSLLYAYLKLLALACAVEIICINEDVGCLQDYADRLTGFVEGVKRAGKKKPSLEDLFLSEQLEKVEEGVGERIIDQVMGSEDLTETEKTGYAYSLMKTLPNEKEDPHRVPKLFYLLQPVYPDLIREFIVDYYLEEQEWRGFTITARSISILEFGLFLARAIEDFPDFRSFRQMMMTPPEYGSDLFEYYITLLAHAREVGDWDDVVGVLCRSDMARQFGLWELELWRRLAIVLEEKEDYNGLLVYGLRFADYLAERLEVPKIAEYAPEVLDAWLIGLHNAEQTEQLTSLLDRFDQLADQVQEDGYIATVCAETRARLLILHLRKDNRRGARRNFERLGVYARRFPKDEDIAAALSSAARDWVDVLIESRLPQRVRRAVEQVEAAQRWADCEKVRGDLAILLANEFYLHVVLEEDGLQSTMDHCREQIDSLFAAHPEEKHVVQAYASIQANDYICMAKECTSQEECEQFRRWHEQWPDSIEFAEYYGKALFGRYIYLWKNGQHKQARVVLKTLKTLAGSVDYGEEENELEKMVGFIHAFIAGEG